MLTFQAAQPWGEVSAELVRPEGARWLLVLAHGAGAGMRHTFMENIARIGRRTGGHVSLSVPVHGAPPRQTGPASGADSDGARCDPRCL